MPPVVTLTVASLLALVNMWLGFRTGLVRRRLGIATGDGGAAPLVARMRAQANFAEYVPIAVLLLALVELAGGDRRGLWVLGALLLIGRLVHPFGMDAPGVGRLRTLGFALTALVTLILAVWALDRAWLITHLGIVSVPGRL